MRVDTVLGHAFLHRKARRVTGSPAWLTVRGTTWSDIARARFTHTKRTMFDVVA